MGVPIAVAWGGVSTPGFQIYRSGMGLSEEVIWLQKGGGLAEVPKVTC